MRNSNRSSAKKVDLLRQHGAEAQMMKQKLKMKQAQPSEFDLSKKKSQPLTAYIVGRKLRK